MSERIEIGDVVEHGPSGEEWTVCYADYKTGKLAWFGWPDGLADIANCTLIRKSSPERRAQWIKLAGQNAASQRRFAKAFEMYGEAISGPISGPETKKGPQNDPQPLVNYGGR
jgi:hypothetical protein